ncbi:MAG TPA: hypothetical protein VKS01_10255 [Bryobacteraceae bacterium]|nr:hypothetical protein [Bryobacteraceae bacterium]
MKMTTLLMFVAALLALAAERPNLSGTWEMDLKQSNFGDIPAPDSFKRTIVDNEPSLVMTDEQSSALGQEKAVRNYTTDGKEITYQWNGGEVKSAAHWEGDKLIVIGKVDANGAEVTVTSSLTLASDGKTLTEDDKISMAGNDVAAFKLVLVKK